MNQIKPVFVVGPSRSGTSIARILVNGSQSIHLSDETHFFEDLQLKFSEQTLLDESQKNFCEDYFLALAHRPYGHDGNAGHGVISREMLASEAEKIGGNSLAYFMAYCQIGARERGKTRWGEKTPRHIFCLERIFRAFPEAQVVCMVRDPRACVLSYRDWASHTSSTTAAERKRISASYNIIVASLLWRTAVETAQAAQKKWGKERVYLLKYEDLVAQGEAAVEDLMAWLNEKFTGSIANIPLFNSSYEDARQGVGLSDVSLFRWRQKLTAGEIQTIEFYCGDTLLHHLYKPVYPRRITMGIVMASTSFPWAVLRALMANRKRIRNIPQYLWQRSRAFLKRK